MDAYPIMTERLCLRPFTRGDVDAVYAYRQREDVSRYLFDDPMSRQTCEEAVTMRVNQLTLHEDGDRIVLAVERTRFGDLIGEISLIQRGEEGQQGEIGYIFNPDFHGQGYATEAATALIAFGFETCDLHRIFARCDPRNGASYRLMERVGMQREAHFRGHMQVKGAWSEEYIYAALADEWAQTLMRSATA